MDWSIRASNWLCVMIREFTWMRIRFTTSLAESGGAGARATSAARVAAAAPSGLKRGRFDVTRPESSEIRAAYRAAAAFGFVPTYGNGR